jgi:hypothetical protein
VMIECLEASTPIQYVHFSMLIHYDIVSLAGIL